MQELFCKRTFIKKCFTKMKVLRSGILCVLMIFGELVLTNSKEQHIHVHKHRMHRHSRQESEASNKKIESTTKINVIRKHIHSFQSKGTINNNGMQYQTDSRNKERRTISDNKTEDKEYKQPVNVQISSKNSKRLMFRNEVNLIVRQHAAKSIKLDCHVKRVPKSLLKVRWFKDGVSIEAIKER